MVCQMRGRLSHPPTGPRRADAAALSRERDQEINAEVLLTRDVEPSAAEHHVEDVAEGAG